MENSVLAQKLRWMLVGSVMALVACGGGGVTDSGINNGDAQTPVDTSVAADVPSTMTMCMSNNDCPGMQTCNPMTNLCENPVNPNDPCAMAITCGDCTAQNSCGFCSTTGTCRSGTEMGPSSGTCAGNWAWTPNQCAGTPDAGCTPSCNNRMCGNDGCGGSCGTCSNGDTCDNGQCAPPPVRYGAPCTTCDDIWAGTHNCAVGGAPAIRAECGQDGWCRRGPLDAAGYCTSPCRAGACPAGYNCQNIMVGQNFCVR